MTALSANVEIDRKEGELIAHPVAVDIIYKGALVKHNAAGFLAPCAAEAGAHFAGVAYEKIDNSAGSAGDDDCRTYKKGRFLLTGSSFAQADVGEKVYATDDATITKTYADNLQFVGVIDEYVSATQVWVTIDSATERTAGAFEVFSAGTFTTAGGDTDETITVTGMLATDVAIVTLATAGASPVTVIDSIAAAGQIDVDMSADPSTDHVLNYMVLRKK